MERNRKPGVVLVTVSLSSPDGQKEKQVLYIPVIQVEAVFIRVQFILQRRLQVCNPFEGQLEVSTALRQFHFQGLQLVLLHKPQQHCDWGQHSPIAILLPGSNTCSFFFCKMMATVTSRQFCSQYSKLLSCKKHGNSDQGQHDHKAVLLPVSQTGFPANTMEARRSAWPWNSFTSGISNPSPCNRITRKPTDMATNCNLGFRMATGFLAASQNTHQYWLRFTSFLADPFQHCCHAIPCCHAPSLPLSLLLQHSWMTLPKEIRFSQSLPLDQHSKLTFFPHDMDWCASVCVFMCVWAGYVYLTARPWHKCILHCCQRC